MSTDRQTQLYEDRVERWIDRTSLTYQFVPLNLYDETQKLSERAIEEMLGEIKLLREALISMRDLAGVSTGGDPWYAENEGLDADAIFKQARSALGEKLPDD